MGRESWGTQSDRRAKVQMDVQRIVAACVAAVFLWAVAAPNGLASEEPAPQVEALQPEEPKPHVVSLDDNFTLQIGRYLPAFFTELRVDSRELGEGTDINFEDQLGLDKDLGIWRADGQWRIGRKQRVGFSYYRFDRDASALLEEDIEFGEVIFPAGAGVASDLEVTLVLAKYLYSFRQTERTDYAASIGVHYLGTSVSLETTSGPDLSASAAADLPLPMIGLEAVHLAGRNWRLRGDLEFLSISLGDYSGFWRSFDVSAAYYPNETYGIGLGYSAFVVDADADRDTLLGEIEYRYRGLRVFGVARW